MRTFGDVNLGEGSELVNATVARGSDFPQLPNNGELFFYTGPVQNQGLYIYNETSWILVASSNELVSRVETYRPKRLQLTSSKNLTIGPAASVDIEWDMEIYRDPGHFNYDPSDRSKIILPQSGVYQITYKVNVEMVTYNKRKVNRVEVYQNDNIQKLGTTHEYIEYRNDLDGKGTNTVSYIFTAGMNDIIHLKNVNPNAKQGTIKLLGDECSLSIIKLM